MAIRRRDYRPFLSRQQKLNLFRDCTVVHPHLKKAYEEFRDAVNNPGGASLIFWFGPTGVGKTTLLRQITKVMIEEHCSGIAKDSDYLPVATVEARAPESGSFDWKGYYQSVLASLTELPVPASWIPKRSKLKKSKPYQPNIGSSTSHLSTLREQVIVNIRHRRLIVFLTDEAQRFSRDDQQQQTTSTNGCNTVNG